MRKPKSSTSEDRKTRLLLEQRGCRIRLGLIEKAPWYDQKSIDAHIAATRIAAIREELNTVAKW